MSMNVLSSAILLLPSTTLFQEFFFFPTFFLEKLRSLFIWLIRNRDIMLIYIDVYFLFLYEFFRNFISGQLFFFFLPLRKYFSQLNVRFFFFFFLSQLRAFVLADYATWVGNLARQKRLLYYIIFYYKILFPSSSFTMSCGSCYSFFFCLHFFFLTAKQHITITNGTSTPIKDKYASDEKELGDMMADFLEHKYHDSETMMKKSHDEIDDDNKKRQQVLEDANKIVSGKFHSSKACYF